MEHLQSEEPFSSDPYFSYVFITKIGLHSIDFINKTLVNDDFSKKKIYLFMFKVISSENVSFQSYQNKIL